MFNVTGGELVIILLLALMVLGPQRLPQAARTIGKVMAQIRDVSSSFQRELKDAFDEVSDPVTKPVSRPQLTALDGGAQPPAPPEAPATVADAAPEGLEADTAPAVVDDAAPESTLLDPGGAAPTAGSVAPADAAGLVMPTPVGTIDATSAGSEPAPSPFEPEVAAPPVQVFDQEAGGRQDS
jgi:sec-independent protein translocase protein TatB